MRRVSNVSTAYFFAIVFALTPFLALASEPESFPYEAVVTVEEAAVHSGPGEEFYATSQLGQGSRVDVYRHDSGDWRMIRPPEKAFSLIPAESVQSLRNGMARIVADDVCARVGSSLADEFNVEQIPLRIGTRVELLPETPAPEGWVAIKPLRGEYRWIRAENLERVDRKPVLSAPETAESAMAADSVGSSGDSSESNQSASLFDSLAELDRQLEGLDEENPSVWPLEALSVGYLRLKRSQLDLAHEIDARLARIAELKSIRDEHLGVADVPSAADSPVAVMEVEPEKPAPAEVAATEDPVRKAYRRPAEVAEYYPTNINALPRDNRTAGQPESMTNDDEPKILSPGEESVEASVMAGPTVHLETPTAASPPRSTERAIAAKPSPADGFQPPAQTEATPRGTGTEPRRFDAVGYLQRAMKRSAGGPAYILVSREGEISAYLELPANASVERYIGYPMGVDGTGRRAANLKLPVIAVERLTPVRF